MDVVLERAYSDEKKDGYCVLVDRLWPRGISKEELNHDEWLKEVAPSDELRKYFDHDEEIWKNSQRGYWHELNQKRGILDELIEEIDNEKLVLLYGASDKERNNAVILRNFLLEKFPELTLE